MTGVNGWRRGLLIFPSLSSGVVRQSSAPADCEAVGQRMTRVSVQECVRSCGSATSVQRAAGAYAPPFALPSALQFTCQRPFFSRRPTIELHVDVHDRQPRVTAPDGLGDLASPRSSSQPHRYACGANYLQAHLGLASGRIRLSQGPREPRLEKSVRSAPPTAS